MGNTVKTNGPRQASWLEMTPKLGASHWMHLQISLCRTWLSFDIFWLLDKAAARICRRNFIESLKSPPHHTQNHSWSSTWSRLASSYLCFTFKQETFYSITRPGCKRHQHLENEECKGSTTSWLHLRGFPSPASSLSLWFCDCGNLLLFLAVWKQGAKTVLSAGSEQKKHGNFLSHSFVCNICMNVCSDM